MASSSPPRLINLIRGWPSPTLLPSHILSRAMDRVLSDPSKSVPALQYGPDPGYQPLREVLAHWLSDHYGVHDADPERICITGGASQNLANILASFTDPAVTRAVWMVAPCYHLACGIFEDAGFKGRLRAVTEDDDGINLTDLSRKLEELEEKDKVELRGADCFKDPGPFRKHYRHVIYVVATCANPSGKTMPLSRRQDLIRLARKHNALIISDDVYDFLQWPVTASSATEDSPSNMRIPRLSDVDASLGIPPTGPSRFGNAVSNGSFSKMAGPGVRTGWAEASPAFAKGLSQTGATRSGGAPSQLCAAMMSEMLAAGELQKFIAEKTRPSLQRRHRLMMDAVNSYIAPVSGVQTRESSLRGEDVYGGYFVWFQLSGQFSAKQVADAAMQEENIIIGHGNMFEVKGDEKAASFDQHVRLCFSWEPEDDIVDAVKRLGGLLDRMNQDPEGYLNKAKRDGAGEVGLYK